MLSFRQVQNGSFLAPGLALIFDMDGVLIDSTATHTRAWELYLDRLGIREDSLMQRMLGKRNDEIVKALLGDDLPENEVFRHGAAKEQLYRDLMDPVFDDHVVGGVAEFVRKAAEAGEPRFHKVVKTEKASAGKKDERDDAFEIVNRSQVPDARKSPEHIESGERSEDA